MMKTTFNQSVYANSIRFLFYFLSCTLLLSLLQTHPFFFFFYIPLYHWFIFFYGQKNTFYDIIQHSVFFFLQLRLFDDWVQIGKIMCYNLYLVLMTIEFFIFFKIIPAISHSGVCLSTYSTRIWPMLSSDFFFFFFFSSEWTLHFLQHECTDRIFYDTRP